MGFVRRARDRHFRAMCRCPSPRTTSNGLLRLGYSVHPTSLSRSHPVDLSRLDFRCFPLLYFTTAFAELLELTRTDAPRNCTPMLAARPTMAEKKTEHFLSLPVSSVPVVLCSVRPPPLHHHSTIYHEHHQRGRRPALPPGHGALLPGQQPKSRSPRRARWSSRSRSKGDGDSSRWIDP